MLKFDAEKNADADFEIDFGVNFGAVWGERGVAEFKLRLQADFNSSSHTPCTPGRGAADQKYMKNPSKNRGRKKDGPKSRKIEARGAQGS